MLTPEERKRFRHYLLDAGITMKDFCEREQLNYGSFRNGFNGRQPMYRNSYQIVQDVLRDYNKQSITGLR